MGPNETYFILFIVFVPIAYCLSLSIFILVCILTLSSWSIFSNIYTLTKPVIQFFLIVLVLR